jgi:hypothetical protein
MSIDRALSQPENPSERYPLMPIILRCNHCGQDFTVWKEFLDHMEKSSHRICYKCGYSCGGMVEYLRSEFIAIHQIDGTVESWKYKHIIPCPFLNPSKRSLKNNDI